ncbi:hypothetical protein GCM10023093_28840 [Nemorincola caseinilytica]|uniref:Uncharacterized protein n=1 Tax=Nemorincola caseinilytica TaxID=2054315 RepID=A0ABP8NQI8_9BACT
MPEMKLFLKFLLSFVMLFSGYGHLNAYTYRDDMPNGGMHRVGRNDLIISNIHHTDLAFRSQPTTHVSYNNAERTDKDSEDDDSDDEDDEEPTSSGARHSGNYFTSFLSSRTYSELSLSYIGLSQSGLISANTSPRYILYRVFRI